MRPMRLNEILRLIGDFKVDKDHDYQITWAANRPGYLEDNRVLFHLQKDEELDWGSFKEYCSYAVVLEASGKPGIEQHGKYVIVRVKDVEKAYWKFVEYYRGQFNIPVIAVTGTCGKTTTKEMLKHIFSQDRRVCGTHSTSNSSRLDLSYLLDIDDDVDAAVFEVGVMFPDDVTYDCRHFTPNIGIITTIGVDHLRYCGSLEKYIQAKAEILRGLQYKGTLILNADNDQTREIDLKPYRGKVYYFGRSSRADFRISDVRYEEGGMKYKLRFDGETYLFFLPEVGEHNVYNAVAAIAGAFAGGLGVKEAGERLKSFKNLPHHTWVQPGLKKCKVIDDTWSSNPTSVEAALAVLKELGRGKKRVLVLGRMSSQLAEKPEEWYVKLAKLVVKNDVDILITRGELAQITGQCAIEQGMKASSVFICPDSEKVIKTLRQVADDKSVVLVKTSWHDYMTEILEALGIKEEK